MYYVDSNGKKNKIENFKNSHPIVENYDHRTDKWIYWTLLIIAIIFVLILIVMLIKSVKKESMPMSAGFRFY
jgi:t-SNARE complex subunit (syntaxin)